MKCTDIVFICGAVNKLYRASISEQYTLDTSRGRWRTGVEGVHMVLSFLEAPLYRLQEILFNQFNKKFFLSLSNFALKLKAQNDTNVSFLIQ